MLDGSVGVRCVGSGASMIADVSDRAVEDVLEALDVLDGTAEDLHLRHPLGWVLARPTLQEFKGFVDLSTRAKNIVGMLNSMVRLLNGRQHQYSSREVRQSDAPGQALGGLRDRA